MVDTLLQHSVTRLLEQLGDTPESIGRALQAQGFLGQRGSPGCCVIAMYLRSHGFFTALVTPHDIVSGLGAWKVYPSAHLSLFIRDFDNGCFPHLEESVSKT